MTWKRRAPTIPPTTAGVATAYRASSDTRPRRSRTGSQTPKKMPTAVKMPCHASWIGPRWTFGSNGRFSGAAPLASVALLVLLARAAPAGIVAAQLLGPGPRVRPCVPRCRSSVRSVPARGRGLRLRLPRRRLCRRLVLLFLLGLRSGADGDAQDRLRHLGRDLGGHLVEERPCFVLVRDERILLAVAAQVDPLTELLHL